MHSANKLINFNFTLAKVEYFIYLHMEPTQENEIIIYQPDETLKLDVQVEGDTVWLTQAQMVELFQTTKQNISLHTNNIFKEGELDANSVVKDSLTTASDGKKYRTKKLFKNKS